MGAEAAHSEPQGHLGSLVGACVFMTGRYQLWELGGVMETSNTDASYFLLPQGKLLAERGKCHLYEVGHPLMS